jgi:hypothetical protein
MPRLLADCQSTGDNTDRRWANGLCQAFVKLKWSVNLREIRITTQIILGGEPTVDVMREAYILVYTSKAMLPIDYIKCTLTRHSPYNV